MFIYQENRRLKMHFAASLCSSYILHVRLLTCNEQWSLSEEQPGQFRFFRGGDAIGPILHNCPSPPLMWFPYITQEVPLNYVSE